MPEVRQVSSVSSGTSQAAQERLGLCRPLPGPQESGNINGVERFFPNEFMEMNIIIYVFLNEFNEKMTFAESRETEHLSTSQERRSLSLKVQLTRTHTREQSRILVKIRKQKPPVLGIFY